MSESYTANDLLNAIAAASKTLSERKDEINRLNVFPVPDGDTGTNMSLTLETVVENLAALPIGASGAEIRKAITTGALMGARGNSGVITSQILRGLCEGSVGHDELNADSIEAAFSKSQEVAFQAVRKPVEGTILTVLKDSASAAKRARKKKLSCDEALAAVVEEAYASVQRTPDLLPVLKENGVVDAGGFGLAIFFDAFVAALTGKEGPLRDELAFARNAAPKVEIEQVNDWEGSAFRYCTEFLVHSDTVDVDAAREFLPTMGDCDLMVGMHPNFKVHVHSNRPDEVLGWFLTHDSQISEVHIHNMQLQSAARTDALAAEEAAVSKPLGFVAVAAGEGNAKILKSLGVDVVVSGGQTMNPSTKDLLDAAGEVNADAVIFLPNNKNIIMAAQSACELADKPCAVVPTRSVPEAFAALFGFDEDASLDDNVESMTEAYADVKTGEVTTAIKDSKDAHDNPIKEGDVIGIADGSIESVGSSTEEVVMALLSVMDADDADTLTILAGEDIDDDAFDALVARIEEAHEDLEIDAHRGDQPLYPIVMSVE
ncbi:DAK2 domain-containing protein [Paraeggerthella hongkongensis]|uniref:DAK2 domain-containing protein n=1 Tax=Paraeggerthella TaxID=651554 RepID=UPI000DF75DA9|nr:MULTISPECIES: DAK2 domain-containing protein [Paraeggerthella]MBU5404597.1 DAK2 domain-containing protein [Paraeggerthella hongkongensis]MCD2432292.1 DAK2 domain-containing protein [Paraeggerthella hominis]RDB60080.1 Dak phosphatase [Paraeggerthella hongkongensis]